MRTALLTALLLASLALSGCVRTRCCPRECPPGRTVVPPKEKPMGSPTARRLYSGAGRPLPADALHAQIAAADVVLFGELHGNPAGSALQHEVVQRLIESGRPFALAMEFFERDVQDDLDAYLAGELEETEFLSRTRQTAGYPTSHRPLIELCKEHGVPVIAANAPRPLVRAFRKTEADYAEFLAGLSDAERASLPRTTTRPDDAYKQRFMDLMGPKRGPSFFRSQALWDDAMAEAVADFRTDNPDHLVLLIVGVFHVSGEGGTLTKIRTRRPADRVYSLALTPTADPRLGFDPDARSSADAVVMVWIPPRE